MIYQPILGFLYCEVYDMSCGSIVVKYVVATNQDTTTSETDLADTFENTLDSDGYIENSGFRVISGTTLPFIGTNKNCTLICHL